MTEKTELPTHIQALIREYVKGDRVRATIDIDYINEGLSVHEGTLGTIARKSQGLCHVIWDQVNVMSPGIAGPVLATSGDCLEPHNPTESHCKEIDFVSAYPTKLKTNSTYGKVDENQKRLPPCPKCGRLMVPESVVTDRSMPHVVCMPCGRRQPL